MRIGYLIQQYPPETGAGPARAGEMVAEWVAAGDLVRIFTAMPNRPQGRIYAGYRGKIWMRERIRDVEVYRSWLHAHPGGGMAHTLANNVTFTVGSTCATLLAGHRSDVIIASAPPFLPQIGGIVAAAVLRVPLVLEIRDLWPDYLIEMGVVRGGAAKALLAVERWMFGRAKAVVTVTESLKAKIVGKGVPADRVEVMPNGVQGDLYYPERAARPPLEALARRDGECLIGYLGNFGRGQDLTVVLEGARLLQEGAPGVRLVLAGDGPDGQRIRQLATAMGLRNVTIAHAIPKEETRAFYNACDACIVPLAPLPSFDGAIPSKLFEIMACEVPVIASLRGEAARLIQRAGAGLVVPPGDPGALAEAIRRLSALSTAERWQMGARGRAFVLENFDRRRIAERYRALLQRVAGEKAPPRGKSLVRPEMTS